MTVTDAIVASAVYRMELALINGDASIGVHAATCGTSLIEPRRCHVNCDCPCHGKRKAS